MNFLMSNNIRGTVLIAVLIAIVKCSLIMNHSVNGHWKFSFYENPHGMIIKRGVFCFSVTTPQMSLTSSNRHILLMHPVYACVRILACLFLFCSAFCDFESKERDQLNGSLYRSISQTTTTATKLILCNTQISFLLHFTVAA